MPENDLFGMTATQSAGQARVPYVDQRVLMGSDIRRNAVPSQSYNAADGVRFFHPATRKGFGMTLGQLSKHLLLLGGIGSGKTNVFNLMLHQLLGSMNQNDVMLIFDTKGDFARKFYNPQNPCHILIGNGRAYRRYTSHWNVFQEILENQVPMADIELSAREIAAQLFRDRGSETQPFFASAATDLVAKVIIDFVRTYYRTRDASRLHNAELVAFFRSAGIKEYSAVLQKPENLDFRSAQMYIGDPDEPMNGQALGVFGEINSMVSDLFTGIFADGRDGLREVSMRRIVREKGRRVVFIEYDLSLGEVLGPIYRLLIDLALKEALGRATGEREPGSVYLVVDEFKLLPNLLHIDDALNFGRSLGVKVMAGLQSIQQLYDIYGESRGKSIAAGFMNSFCFQTWDTESRKYISERFGRNYSAVTYRIEGEPIRVQKDGFAVEDWDILKLGVGEAFVNMVGYEPFIYQFPEYNRG